MSVGRTVSVWALWLLIELLLSGLLGVGTIASVWTLWVLLCPPTPGSVLPVRINNLDQSWGRPTPWAQLDQDTHQQFTGQT